MKREARLGELKDTVSGKMYQYHNIWLSEYVGEKINEKANKSGMDSNHLIGFMIEEFFQNYKNFDSIEDRIKFFKKTILPRLLNKKGEEKNG